MDTGDLLLRWRVESLALGNFDFLLVTSLGKEKINSSYHFQDVLTVHQGCADSEEESGPGTGLSAESPFLLDFVVLFVK